MDADHQAAPDRANGQPGVSAARGLVVRNETARKVVIKGDGVELVLAPFAETKLSSEDRKRFDEDALRHSAYVDAFEPTPAKPRATEDNPWLGLLGFLILAVPIWAIVGAFVGSPGYWRIGVLAIAAVIVLVVAASLIRKRQPKSRGSIADWLAGARDRATQQMYLSANVAIGVLVPAAVIVFSAELLDVIDEMRSAKPGTDLHPHVLTLVGRGLQLVFIAVVSLLPALLFFLFDREQLATMRDRFMRQIVRFDGTVETRSDIRAKYGRAMDEAYGHGRGRLLPGRRSPVLVATVIITLGWILTLAHADSELIRTGDGLLALLEPPREPVVYAFLGAYVYALGVVLRGYVRKDLRPKSYSHITVRTILVIVLAWVLQLWWSGDALLLIVFVAGLVPETAIVLIKEALRGVTALRFPFPFIEEEPDPLTKLEGIDVYDRARLLDEGVASVEGLAHHDVVELMLQTRIHASQLVDWVDQAILYLHAGPRKATDGTDRETTLGTLRAYGIRTATDLVKAVDEAAKRQGNGKLDGVLANTPGGSGGPSRIQVIYDVIRDEEWMPNLIRWHSDDAVEPKPHQIDAPPKARAPLQPKPVRAPAPQA
jgi:hypothetical protein